MVTESRCPTCGGLAGEEALSRGPGRLPCLWLGHGRKPPLSRQDGRESAKRALAVALAASTDEEIREAVGREMARRRDAAIDGAISG